MTSSHVKVVGPLSQFDCLFVMVCLFVSCTAVGGSGKVMPFNLRLTTPVRCVAQTDRPKMVRNICVERFGVFM